MARSNKIKERRKARQQDVYAQSEQYTFRVFLRVHDFEHLFDRFEQHNCLSTTSRNFMMPCFLKEKIGIRANSTRKHLMHFGHEFNKFKKFKVSDKARQAFYEQDVVTLATLSEALKSDTSTVEALMNQFNVTKTEAQLLDSELAKSNPKPRGQLHRDSKIGINDMSKRDELKRLGREHDAFKKKLNELKVSDEAKRAFYEQGVVTKGLLRREDVYGTHRVEVLMTRFKLSEKQAEELVTAAQLRRRVSVEHIVDPQGRGCWRVARKHKLIDNQTLLEEVQEAIDDTPDAHKQTHDQLVGAPNMQFKPVTQTRKRRIEDALDELQQMGGLDDVACPSPKPSTISPSL